MNLDKYLPEEKGVDNELGLVDLCLEKCIDWEGYTKSQLALVLYNQALSDVKSALSKVRVEDVVGLRKEVRLFAQAMERKLQKNDYKGGWKDCNPNFLRDKLREELKEFQTTIDNGFTNRMLNEGADVANIIMMLCDVGERLK